MFEILAKQATGPEDWCTQLLTDQVRVEASDSLPTRRWHHAVEQILHYPQPVKLREVRLFEPANWSEMRFEDSAMERTVAVYKLSTRN